MKHPVFKKGPSHAIYDQQLHDKRNISLVKIIDRTNFNFHYFDVELLFWYIVTLEKFFTIQSLLMYDLLFWCLSPSFDSNTNVEILELFQSGFSWHQKLGKKCGKNKKKKENGVKDSKKKKRGKGENREKRKRKRRELKFFSPNVNSLWTKRGK